MAKSNADRALDRRVNIIFRTSAEDREHLKARAAAAGVSVQVFLESLAFDRPLVPARKSGPSTQQELPMTG